MNADPGPTEKKGQPGLVSAALSGLCPRCGAKTLFAAPAGLQKRLARLLGVADGGLPLQLVEHILLLSPSAPAERTSQPNACMPASTAKN